MTLSQHTRSGPGAIVLTSPTESPVNRGMGIRSAGADNCSAWVLFLGRGVLPVVCFEQKLTVLLNKKGVDRRSLGVRLGVRLFIERSRKLMIVCIAVGAIRKMLMLMGFSVSAFSHQMLT
jgi:hypothetical protein